MKNSLISIGIVAGVFGLKGELKIDSLTDYPERFNKGELVTLGGQTYLVESSRPTSTDRFILKLVDINSRAQAAKIVKDTLIEIPQDDLRPLPKGSYYRFELIDIDVLSYDDVKIGTVTEIVETGANDVFVVVKHDGTELLIPNIPANIEIDLSTRTMRAQILKEI